MKIDSLADLKKIVQAEVLPLAKDKTVILLSGDIGAGKTQLVKTFCEVAETSEPASSPTFSIIQEYSWKQKTIYHVDLYRIESAGELENTGFWEIFDNATAVAFIEWPEKMDLKRIPKNWKQVQIQIKLAEKNRELSIQK